MGDLNRLSQLQEEFRGIISYMRREGEKSYQEVMEALATTFPEDELVNVAVIHMEMTGHPDRLREPSIDDLIWAGEFLDHLDTLNWTIRPRNKRGRRRLLQAMPDVSSGGRD